VNIVTDHRSRIGTWSIRRFASAPERFASFRGRRADMLHARSTPSTVRRAIQEANGSMATPSTLSPMTTIDQTDRVSFWGAKTLFES